MMNFLGMDKALFYSLLSRGWQLAAGVVTLFLVVHCMQPVLQGFFYTFRSLLNIELFFELGLSLVILQTTSRFFTIGSEQAHKDLLSCVSDKPNFLAFVKKTVYWYAIAVLIFIALLIPGGFAFFSLHENAAHVHWQWPWVFVVMGAGTNLALLPFLAVIEGSGRILSTYRFRTVQFISGNLLAWFALYYLGGLWMAVFNVWTNAVIAIAWLLIQYRPLFISAWTAKINSALFSWKKEIWPMQWRIAFSWMSGFFISQIFTPLLFYYQGPVVAGKMGISLAIMSMLSIVCLTWVSTRSAIMGKIIAQSDWLGIDALFSKIFWQSVSVFVLLGSLIALVVFENRDTWLGQRLLNSEEIILLLLATLASHIVGALALYLRAYKKDPFMPLSIIGAVLLGSAGWLTAAKWGSSGVCWSIFIINVAYGLPTGIWLWSMCKRKWQVLELSPTLTSET